MSSLHTGQVRDAHAWAQSIAAPTEKCSPSYLADAPIIASSLVVEMLAGRDESVPTLFCISLGNIDDAFTYASSIARHLF